MQIQANREALLAPLSKIINSVDRRGTLPILNHALVEVQGSTARFTGTDLEVESVAEANVDSAEAGSTAIPARKLYDILRSLPDTTKVKLKVSAEKALVQAGRSRFTLALLPASDFPKMEVEPGATHITLPQSQLLRLIKQVSFAMAVNDVRYYLNGLVLEVRRDTLRSVATDGHRLSVAEYPHGVQISEKLQAILPSKSVNELARLLDDSEEEVELQFSPGNLKVIVGGTTLTTKLVAGKFPDYEVVIPIENKDTVTVERELFRAALQRVALLAPVKTGMAIMDVSNNVLELRARGEH